HRLELKPDAIFDLFVGVDDLTGPVVVRDGACAPGDEIVLAANLERRLLAGNRRQRRFGDGLHHAGLFHRIEIAVDKRCADTDGRGRQRLAQAIGSFRKGAPGNAVAVSTSDEVHAELLHHGAADLCDGHLERDLVVADDLQQVDDGALLAFRIRIVDVDAALRRAAGGGLRVLAGRRLAAGHEGVGEIDRPLGIQGRFDGSRQHDVVVDQFDADIRAWNEPLQVLLQAGNVALDVEIETDDLFAIRAEYEDVGLADRLAEQVDAPGGARHGVGDGGVCDQYVVGVGWQVHDHRLVEAELDALAGGRRAYRGLA